MKSRNFPECKQCGQCCSYSKDGKIFICKFLKYTSKNTYCPIYKERYNIVIDEETGDKCGFILDSPFNFEHCPYNTLKNGRLKINLLANIEKERKKINL